ncbi:hypothetical protein [Vibrio caribbeanicus]|uniref:hypothetical protein n=1 Tax=Vibrio caribbeanicus TaxID=701175 RepID=UPI0030DA1D24
MLNITTKMYRLLRRKSPAVSHHNNACAHYTKLLEQKDYKTAIEIEKLEEKIDLLYQAYQDVEVQFNVYKKNHYIQSDILKHLKTHHHLM